MTPIKKTPPGPASGVQEAVRAQQSGPHLDQYSGAVRACKPPKPCYSQSRYFPGGAFQPSKKTRTRREQQVLELLKEVGPRGVRKLDAPRHLLLGFSARVSDLRDKGHWIETIREQVGGSLIARYVLIAEAGHKPGEVA